MKTVFVSSTFRDMQSERDAIREITSPLLNADARSYGDEIDFCDLRWGIDTAELESDTGSRKVLEVCLDEIDRCKPPMIVLLGYRYGWIPDKSLIESAAARKNRQLEARKLQQMQLHDLEMSVTALEIEYGSLRDSRHFSNTLFYFREIEGNAPADFQSEDAEHAAKIQALKDRIRSIGGDKIRDYTLRWNGSGFDGVDEFARKLAVDIKTMLLPQWELSKKLTPFDRECRAHHTFIEEKSAMFRARQAESDKLFNDINANPVTIIKGAVGSGKSTLFCHLVKCFQQSKEWMVLPFISGLTSKSNDAYDIIENIVYFIEEKLHCTHYEEETDQNNQHITHSIDEWRTRLAEMCAAFIADGKKLLIMLDAADQLTQSEVRDSLYFIPTNTGESIHFVMTCTPDFKTPGHDFYNLKSIDNTGKRDVIAGTLGRASRELSKPVIENMISLKSSDNPLYLSLLVQRLLMMNSADFTDIRSRGDGMTAIEAHQIELITKNCPDNLDEMSAALITEAGNRINPALVSKAGQLLSVSRAGLRSRDLSVMLGEDWTEIDFAHFISYMNDCFMQRDDGRYDFTHKSIRAGFLKLCPDVDGVNKQILTYIKSLPDDDPVRISEVIYHAIKADDKEFFVDYIIMNQSNDNKMSITHALYDTYEKCVSDNGAWLVGVLQFLCKNNHLDNKLYLLCYFIIDIFRCYYPDNQDQLNRECFIMTETVKFEEMQYKISDDNDFLLCLSQCYENLAKVYCRMASITDMKKALELYNKELVTLKTLLSERDTLQIQLLTAKLYSEMAGCFFKIGAYMAELNNGNNFENALNYYYESEQIYEKALLVSFSEMNLIGLIKSYTGSMDTYKTLGDINSLKKAKQIVRKCIKLLSNARIIGDSGVKQSIIAQTYSSIAGVYDQAGGRIDRKKAVNYYLKAILLMEQLVAKTCNLSIRINLASLYAMLGDTYEKIGRSAILFSSAKNYDRAHLYYYKGIELLEQIVDELETTDSLTALLSIILKYVGCYGAQDIEKQYLLIKRAKDIAESLQKKTGDSMYYELIHDINLMYFS